MANQFVTVTSSMSKGVQSATKMMQKAVGADTDPDVGVYNQLTPDDFDKIRQQFGDEKTIDWIKRMEVRRMKQGG